MTDATDNTDDLAPLLSGYRRFREGRWTAERARWDDLATGQSPRVLVVACSDSRVDPAQIFDVAPGEIFVVRNVANLVPPAEVGAGRHGVSAAVEFAVTKLEVGLVLVMGHGACGGVKASLTGMFKDAVHGDGGYVAGWIDILAEAREQVLAEHGDGAAGQLALEEAGVRVSLANLRTFPFVAEREAAGTLKLQGARFGIADGVLHLLDEASGRFAPVEVAAVAAG